MNKNHLAIRLKELRNQEGLSQEVLADESSLSLRTIQRIEIVAEKWQDDYNSYHPHSSLEDKSPIEFSNRRQPLLGVLKPQEGAVIKL